ncbi:MAG: efflux RND transporter permease subunit [Bacillus sp. (in: firmicutes)]
MNISNFSIKRPIFTLISMLFVLVLGTVSVFNIPLQLIPDINPPVAVVVTSYEGAGPTEVSEKVGKPLEASLSTLPGLKTMTSTSQEGANLTLLEFSWSTQLEDIENDVLQRIEGTVLPEDAHKPRFMKFDPTQFPVIQLTLSVDKDEAELQRLAEDLELELTKVNGVANVTMSGTFAEEIVIVLKEKELEANRLDQSDVVNVIASNNVSMPGSKVETEGKSLTTRIMSNLYSAEDIEQLAVSQNPRTGESVTIADIAEVDIRQSDDGTITRANQKPAVLLSVLQQSDANTAEVSDAFQERLDELLETGSYKDVDVDILFDQGDFIKLAIGNISSSLVVGGLLAMLVLVFFLKSIKSPIIIGIAIPYSVILTFVLMYFSGFTLNIMTLGGLALGIGMLVDNSIVVIENIYRHLSMGKTAKDAANQGAREIAGAITASTLTTVVVFIPVVFITGIIGDLFLEFALTITFSLFASLLVALTVVPMLASRWLKMPEKNEEERRQRTRPMRFFKHAISWCLHHRIIVLAITLLLLIGGLFGLSTVGTQFLPNADEGYFTVDVELENGTGIPETEKVVDALEDRLSEVEEVDVYVSYIGSTQSSAFNGGTEENKAEIYVKLKDLKDRERTVFQIADALKEDLETLAGGVNESAKISMELQSTSGTAPNTLTFNMRDTDKGRLEESAQKLQEELQSIRDITEVSTNLEETVEEIQIKIDREKALQHGFVPAQIAEWTNDATRGSLASQIVTDSGEVQSVLVQYEKEAVNNIERLKRLSMKKADGSFVELQEVAAFSIGKSPVSIQRINNQDAVQFTVKYSSDTTLGDITEKVEKVFDDIVQTDEIQIVYSGERDLLDTAMDQMALALVLSVIFIYFVMAAQFESLKYPFVIMFSVPLFVIGVSIGLTVTGTPLGLTAIIGIIVLAGIVVNNAIVIVDYINKRKDAGVPTYQALVTSVLDRVRPILMTSLTTILGLVPMALGIGEGTEINQPLGIVVIGGLISSTLLTLFVIPVVYSFFDKQTRKKWRLKRQADEMAERAFGKNRPVHIESPAIKEIRSIIHKDK